MSENIALADEQGVIRYDWLNIQLLYVAGASAADIARNLTQDCPESYDTVRKTIATRSQRYEWSQTAEKASSLVKSNPSSIYKPSDGLSPNVVALGQSIALERKTRYVDRMAAFGDRASKLLEDRTLDTLEDAAMAGKLMEPVHGMMKDIHGLNAREPVASLNVNILSEGGMPTFDMSDDSKQE